VLMRVLAHRAPMGHGRTADDGTMGGTCPKPSYSRPHDGHFSQVLRFVVSFRSLQHGQARSAASVISRRSSRISESHSVNGLPSHVPAPLVWIMGTTVEPDLTRKANSGSLPESLCSDLSRESPLAP
jgi:hypothetical protein